MSSDSMLSKILIWVGGQESRLEAWGGHLVVVVGMVTGDGCSPMKTLMEALAMLILMSG